MDIEKNILNAFNSSQHIKSIKNELNSTTDKNIFLKKLCGDAYFFYLNAIINQSDYKNFIIVQKDYESILTANNFWININKNYNINIFPCSYEKKHSQKQSIQNLILRTIALNNLLSKQTKNIIITQRDALLEQIAAKENFKKNIIEIKNNNTLNINTLFSQLNNLNFDKTDFVYQAGQYAMRGGIVDIFSFNYDKPHRIELDGNSIASIRAFDPETQLSIETINNFQIIASLDKQEKNNTHTFFEFLNDNDTLFFIEEYDKILQPFIPFTNQREQLFEDEDVNKEHIQFIDIKYFETQIKKNRIIAPSFITQTNNEYTFNTEPQCSYNREYKIMAHDFIKWQEKNYTIYISTAQEKQFNRIENIVNQYEQNIKLNLFPFTLSEGFIDHELKNIFFTDHQIFQRYHRPNSKKIKSQDEILSIHSLNSLQEGDYLTHIDYGVGRFSGLQKLNINNVEQEAVRMIYKDNDVLYVNINSLYKLSKYSSKDGIQPQLHKIGSDAWAKIKAKTKVRIKTLAFDLIKLYAERKKDKGFAYAPDNFMAHELEASFIYEDTPDQQKVNQEIKTDMENESPMDRLICGDVGFGKTELAIRAAFKACCDNKQVAVLVPTTVLAFQHYNTFKERLKSMPVKIDFINRFRTTKEKTKIIEELKNGTINIIISTHAILNKKIMFNDLGLIIIDEEQKFGVNAKEALKSRFPNIDCLTLSATPIPRTLQFSLMGARDLSTLHTAPPNRQAVETEIHSFNLQFIKEKIYQEIDRGGQIFFIHNRVQNLNEISGALQSVCPELNIATAHGQLNGEYLENIIVDFMAKKYDVLVATNIIESGIDIPNTNTIFINNAHHFGLSDLHQLRGRVGRSNIKSYCYLLAPSKTLLTNESKRKLQTIERYSDLGSGFQIAMKDLDLRGAGDILGAEQSGFISQIGFDAYQKILNETIRELKQNEFKHVFTNNTESLPFIDDCMIETDQTIFIPNDYITTATERLMLYTQINNYKNDTQLEQLKCNIIDRFGKLPNEVAQLFLVVKIRQAGLKLGFEKIIFKNNELKCFFIANHNSPYFESQIFKNILQYIQTATNKAQIKQSIKTMILIYAQMENLNDSLIELNKMLAFKNNLTHIDNA